MKKGLIIIIALLLAVPAVSFAGSTTSRWDMTIGGYVKFDVGWANQNAGASLDAYFPDRDNRGANKNPANESGAFGMAAGQTALNFLVKGPDAWGAKTSAFIQGSFTGQTTNAGTAGTRMGTFSLNLAYLDFQWANTKLTAGYAWQAWGFLPTFNVLGLYDLLMAGRGNTVPQVTVMQNFSKAFYGSFGIQDPYHWRDNLGMTATSGIVNNPTGIAGAATTGARAVSDIPDFVLELGYKSDACGKIGPNMLQAAVSGFWGQEKILYANPINGPGTTHDTLNRWAANFKVFVPIIPEKNLNKAGALSISGALWTGQNLSDWYLGARNIGSMVPYDADPTTAGVRYASPVVTGGWGNLNFFFTDKVQFNGMYGFQRNYVSEVYARNFPNQFKTWSQIIGNILYDVNPAIRLGVEYNYASANWNYYSNAGPGAATVTSQVFAAGTAGMFDTKAANHTGRVCAWYFF
jgi:hypothetical protein